MIKKICRFCNNVLTNVFADLGTTPLANSYLNEQDLDRVEPYFPLKAYVCEKCLLVQVEEFEKPQKIFSNYAYFSSFSDSWLQHSKKFVDEIADSLMLNKNKLVVEIASNDGYLLQYFLEKNIPVLGIEPATNVAKISQERGIDTLNKFFGSELAEQIAKDHKADLIIANNVLAHTPDLNDFILGMKKLLKDNGVITIEFPHLLNLIKFNQFDTIYHEHFSYFSLLALKRIVEYHELAIFDVCEIPTHGGSLRVYLKHIRDQTHKVKSSVLNIIKTENQFGLNNIETYKQFQKDIDELKKSICDFIINAKKNNKKVVCYGAPAKGNTLLNYCKIDNKLIDCTVDRSPYKQGLYLPGSHIPIRNPDIISNIRPDFLLILPWNLKKEIIEQMSFIKDWGGRFVVLIPKLEII